jgi:pyruvoyl-dependent arginine decarboxylase (PvlArgDC)
MDINEMAKMCAEYRQEIEAKLRNGWAVSYVGPVDALPGGAAKHGIEAGVLCVKARIRSAKIGRMLTVCIGVGRAGRKMDPGMVSAILNGALESAERAKLTLGGI